jgi:disulfide oxidoreductase YuzD
MKTIKLSSKQKQMNTIVKKNSSQSNSQWLKSARGRSFDNLPLLFTFTLFHNNNNNNNLSKPYS